MNTRSTYKPIIAIALVVLVMLALLTLFLDCFSLSSGIRQQISAGLDGYGGQDLLQYAFGSGSGVDGSLLNMAESDGLSLIGVLRLLITASNSMWASELTFSLIAMWSLIIGTLLSAGFAVYGFFCNKKGFSFWFAAMIGLLLIADIITVIEANARIGFGAVSLTAWPFIALLSAAGVVWLSVSGRNALSAIKPGAFPALAGRFSSAVNGGRRLGREEIHSSDNIAAFNAADAGTPRGSADGWVCPNCGRALDSEAFFCSGCGTKRPDKPRCSQCGAAAKPGDAFCVKCGARLLNPIPGIQGAQNPPPAQPQPVQPQPVQPQPVQPQPAQPQPVQPQPAQGFPARADRQSFQSFLPRSEQPSFQPVAAGGIGGMGSLSQAGEYRGMAQIPVQSTQAPIALTIDVFHVSNGFIQTSQLTLKNSLVIGRNLNCNLRIDDRTVSGTHLRIEREGSDVYVTDLNSTNGTHLNGMPLMTRTQLHPEDKLNIGLTMLNVHW